ncbi:MAG: class I SAM-dependent methyltransferase [Armatimonadota bacterium]
MSERPPGTEAVPTGNYFDKYGSRNPITVRLMRGFFQHLDRHLKRAGQVEAVLDIGCGEGQVATFVRERLPGARYCALDIDRGLVAETARRNPGAHCLVSEACSLPWHDHSFDLVLGIEVLEHLRQPEAALAEAARVSRRHVLVSVPNEPLWRVLNVFRGAYLSRLGNTPGHIQHWGAAGFRRLLESRLEVIELSRPLPWLMALCRTTGPQQPSA